MEKVIIILTEDEATDLLLFISESRDTGNKEWDNQMDEIENKINLGLNN